MALAKIESKIECQITKWTWHRIEHRPLTISKHAGSFSHFYLSLFLSHSRSFVEQKSHAILGLRTDKLISSIQQTCSVPGSNDIHKHCECIIFIVSIVRIKHSQRKDIDRWSKKKKTPLYLSFSFALLTYFMLICMRNRWHGEKCQGFHSSFMLFIVFVEQTSKRASALDSRHSFYFLFGSYGISMSIEVARPNWMKINRTHFEHTKVNLVRLVPDYNSHWAIEPTPNTEYGILNTEYCVRAQLIWARVQVCVLMCSV